MIQKWQHLPWPHRYELWFWTTITRFAVWAIPIEGWNYQSSGMNAFVWPKGSETVIRCSLTAGTDYASHDTSWKCSFRSEKNASSAARWRLGRIRKEWCATTRRQGSWMWSLETVISTKSNGQSMWTCVSSARDRSLHVHRIDWNKSRKNLKRISQTLSAFE